MPPSIASVDSPWTISRVVCRYTSSDGNGEYPEDWIKIRTVQTSQTALFGLGCQLEPVELIPDFAARMSCIEIETMKSIVLEPTANDLGEILLDASQVAAPLEGYICPEGTIRVKTKEAITPVP